MRVLVGIPAPRCLRVRCKDQRQPGKTLFDNSIGRRSVRMYVSLRKGGEDLPTGPLDGLPPGRHHLSPV